MNNMSAFEIRLELLKMSQGLVSDEYSYKRSTALEQWHAKVESAKIAGIPSPDIPELPPFPTEDDIVKKAESLNQFVSQTNPVNTKTTSTKK